LNARLDPRPRPALALFLAFSCVVASAPSAAAQEPDTILPHADDARWWVSGQANPVVQGHGDFRSPYEGEHSLRPTHEHAISRLVTIYTGLRLGSRTEIYLDIESAGGGGIGSALGLAGFTDLDVVRNPSLGSAPYLARLFVHHTIPLGRETTHAAVGPHALATDVPVRRVDVRAGKFSTVDWFDQNAVGSDSHLQFLNWTIDNNGAYDYAADTRGYTVGVEAEYQDRRWAVRFAEALMPKVANGLDLDWNPGRARGENLEIEIRRGLIPRRDGVVRVLAYANHANMGSYAEALDAWRAGRDPVPSIDAHREQGRVKTGAGVNVEQAMTDTVRAFGRWGWNEGRHESFAYTEVNRSTTLGGDVRGSGWSRRDDKAGAAIAINELSADHRAYLAAGGLGFLLGDGALTYGAERIVEVYYTAHLARGVFASFDLQRIVNPGYNEDRGPVLVPGLRVHLEF